MPTTPNMYNDSTTLSYDNIKPYNYSIHNSTIPNIEDIADNTVKLPTTSYVVIILGLMLFTFAISYIAAKKTRDYLNSRNRDNLMPYQTIRFSSVNTVYNPCEVERDVHNRRSCIFEPKSERIPETKFTETDVKEILQGSIIQKTNS